MCLHSFSLLQNFRRRFFPCKHGRIRKKTSGQCCHMKMQQLLLRSFFSMKPSSRDRQVGPYLGPGPYLAHLPYIGVPTSIHTLYRIRIYKYIGRYMRILTVHIFGIIHFRLFHHLQTLKRIYHSL